MNITQVFIHLLTVGISLALSGGVLLHDTNLDKAMVAATAKAKSTDVSVSGPNSEPHTHGEHVSVKKLTKKLGGSHPRLPSRLTSDEKYIQTKPVRGHHPFDNHTLPMIAD